MKRIFLLVLGPIQQRHQGIPRRSRWPLPCFSYGVPTPAAAGPDQDHRGSVCGIDSINVGGGHEKGHVVLVVADRDGRGLNGVEILPPGYREVRQFLSQAAVRLLDLQVLQLLREPLLGLGHRLLELLGLRALALPRRLLAAGLASDDLAHCVRPLLSGDALGGEMLQLTPVSSLSKRIHPGEEV